MPGQEKRLEDLASPEVVLQEFPLHTLPAAAIKDKKMMLQPSNLEAVERHQFSERLTASKGLIVFVFC
jgi:hypothetical protein